MKVTVSFYLVKPEATEPTQIWARISYKGNQLKYYPSMTIKPSEWNVDAQRMTESKKVTGYKKFNGRLTDIEDYAKDFITAHHEKTGLIPQTEEVKKHLDEKLKGKTEVKVQYNFMSFFQKMIDDSEKGVRLNFKSKKPITKGTINNYKGTKNVLKDFIDKTKRKVDFNTIDLDFYADFTTYMQKEKLAAVNSIGKHIKTIKTIMNEATEQGYNTNLTFKSKRFITVQEKADNIYLTEDELNLIANKDLSDEPKLDRVRDMFIIGCYTGLRFSDFSILRAENIVDGFIETTQIKTGDAVVIPIHDKVAAILKKYDGVLPPAISNQKTNDYIKDVVKKIDAFKVRVPVTYTQGGQKMTKNIEKYKLVKTHTARRSFATNEFKAGTPTLTIMAITGHKTEAAFLKYIKVNPKEHAQILKLKWQERAKKKRTRVIKLSA